jgi:lipoprotein-anchoring transpeptidase ErfK/SrfK
MAKKAGLQMGIDELEAHYLAGGNVNKVIRALISADKANIPLNYYIHGAYWHHNFGHPMSHGCINVAYANMEGLYNWADVGTPITIE